MKSISRCINRVFAMFLTLALIISMFYLPSIPVKAATFSLGDYYFIQSAVGSDMVLDVNRGSTKSGEKIQLWKAHDTDGQLFRIERNGDGYYTFINKRSKLAMDVSGGSDKSGTQIQQWTRNQSRAQQWKIYTASGYPDGYVRIKNRCGKYLDVNGGSSNNGTKIQIWDRNSSKAQVFKLIPYVQTVYRTITLGAFNSVDQWIQQMQRAEQTALCFPNFQMNREGSISNYGRMITGVSALSYKTITVPVGFWTNQIKLPSKVRFKLHRHSFKQTTWFDFTSVTITQQCSCGERHCFKWDVPYPESYFFDARTKYK